MKRLLARPLVIAPLTAVLFAASITAQKSYDPGASDSEIKIGNIAPIRAGPKSIRLSLALRQLIFNGE